MRYIKLLWGVIGCLLAVVAVLGYMLVQESHRAAPPPADGEEAGGSPDPIIARVGDRDILSSMLQNQLEQRHGPELLNQILDRESIRLEAEDAGIKISREEIDEELNRMQQGYDSEEHFYDSMKKQLSLTKDEIREDVYYKLLLEKIATRHIRISDEDVEAYIDSHPEEFRGTRQLRIQQIVNQTLEQAKRTIELYNGGRDFAALAIERSLDTATAQDGGDIGWVEDDDPFVPAELMKAAHSLQIGDISGPIEVAEGYAVIRLKDKKDTPAGSPELKKETIRKMLALQQAPPLRDIVLNLRSKFGTVILNPQWKE